MIDSSPSSTEVSKDNLSMIHAQPTLAHSSTSILVAGLLFALAGGCTQDLAEDDDCVVGDDGTRSCVDALRANSVAGTLAYAAASGWTLTPAADFSAYYGAIRVRNSSTEAITLRLEAYDANNQLVLSTQGPANGCDASGTSCHSRWIAWGADDVTSVKVINADDNDAELGTLTNFDQAAANSLSLKCQVFSNGDETEILPVDFDDDPSTNGVFRTYLQPDSTGTLHLENENENAMNIWLWSPANEDGSTCTTDRDYTSSWTCYGAIKAGEGVNLQVPNSAYAIGVTHQDYTFGDGDPADCTITGTSDVTPELAANFVELVDASAHVVRFERVADQNSCSDSGSALPVAVPFVGVREDAGTCGQLEFKNCTTDLVTLTATEAGTSTDLCLGPINTSGSGNDCASASPSATATIDLAGVAQHIWAWDIKGDPTVIVRKKDGPCM